MVIRFGLLALTLFLCTPARSETGNGLLQACEALEREALIEGDSIQLPARTDVHECWGYMGAAQDFSAMVNNQTGKRCMSSEHFGQLAWQFKRVSGSSGLKVQAAIAC